MFRRLHQRLFNVYVVKFDMFEWWLYEQFIHDGFAWWFRGGSSSLELSAHPWNLSEVKSSSTVDSPWRMSLGMSVLVKGEGFCCRSSPDPLGFQDEA